MPTLPTLTRSSGKASALPFALLALAAGAAVGAATARSTQLGVVAIAAVVLGVLTVWRPIALGITTVAAVFVVQRLGGTSYSPGSSGGISYSDALVTAAAFLALPALIGTRELRRVRLPLFGLAAYLALLLPTLFLNSSHRAELEWLHRLILVGGALVLGAWLVREQAYRTGFAWLVGVSTIVSVGAIQDTLRHSLHPAQPFQLNKNFVGGVLATVLIVLIVAGRELGVPPRVQVYTTLLIGGGIVASQSRGAMLAVVVGVLLAMAMDIRGHTRRTRALTIFVALVLAGIAYISIRHQLGQTQLDQRNGSLGVRFNVEAVTHRIWRTSPTYGVGLKYFTTNNFGRFAFPANNAVDNELAESGVIGLIGFTIMQAAMFVTGAQRRRHDKLVAAATGSVFGLLLHGMVDIYWTAGTVTLPFVIFGMALARPPAAAPLDAPSAPDASGNRSRRRPAQAPKTTRSARSKTLSQR